MKKILYTVILTVAANLLHAQSLFNKIKSKVVNKVENTVQATVVPAAGSAAETKFTDPSPFGTVIYTFSKSEIDANSGADGINFGLWFTSVKVVNNQLDLQIASGADLFGNYTNGQLVKIKGTADQTLMNKLYNGSEKDGWSKDFSQYDFAASMLKKGAHVSSGMIPGKAEQTFTFNGKQFANYMSALIAHNADSTVVAAVGMGFSKGVTFSLKTSNGLEIILPKQYGGTPLISPDGKMAGALFQGAGTGGNVYLTNGKVVKINGIANNMVWLRNSGSVFYFTNSRDNNVIERNGEAYHTFEMQTDPKTVFISKDDKNMAWMGSHGLYFSDGTAFENATSPNKVVIDNKEVIVFLAGDIRTGKLFLCRHDL